MGREREREREMKRATTSLPDLMVFLGPVATHMITGLQYCPSFTVLENSAYVHQESNCASELPSREYVTCRIMGFNIPLAERENL